MYVPSCHCVSAHCDYSYLSLYLAVHAVQYMCLIDAEIRNAYPTCVCGAALPQIGSFLPKISFLPKMRKASSEERRLCMCLSFHKMVQRRLRIFYSFVQAFCCRDGL